MLGSMTGTKVTFLTLSDFIVPNRYLLVSLGLLNNARDFTNGFVAHCLTPFDLKVWNLG